MKKLLAMSIGVAVVLGFRGDAARGLPPFKNAFRDKYVTAPGANPNLAVAFAKAGCYTCHVAAKPKTVRDDYGQALDKELGKLIPGGAKKYLAAAAGGPAKAAALQKVLKDLDTAFGTVEGQNSPAGPTYGAKMKAGQLP